MDTLALLCTVLTVVLVAAATVVVLLSRAAAETGTWSWPRGSLSPALLASNTCVLPSRVMIWYSPSGVTTVPKTASVLTVRTDG
mgnify:CR=1 FL=1